MNLRARFLLAVVGIGLMLSALFFFIWIPSVDRNSRQVLESYTQDELAITAEVLIPLLIQNQFADIHESLDALLTANPGWVAVELRDENDQPIYPLSPLTLPDDEGYLKVVHNIEFRGKALGKLILTADLEESLAALREQNIKLFLLFVSGLFLGLFGLVIMLNRFVSRPVRNLLFAAEQLSKGDYSASLPPPSQDEIGQLTNGFRAMRDAIQVNEAELKKLSRAVEENPASIVITDQDGAIEYVNPAFTKVSGYTAEEAIGNTPRILKSGKHPAKFYEKLWSTILSGNIWRGEIQNKSKEGTVFWESVSIAPISNSRGKIVNFVGIKEDISQKKAMEASLRESKDEAEMANHAKSEFLSSMSHELRTPLNAILGFSQILKDDPEQPLSEDQNESVDHIWRAGRHLLTLINEVLDLSKIDEGKLEMSVEDVDLRPLFEECVDLISKQAADADITIELKPPSDFYVLADYTRLKQVILNLLSNALKYNRPEGQVRLFTDLSSNETAAISVSDTGQGISDENLENLFQPFNRLGYENGAVEGTGIGLVITKKLVEAMDGSIEVNSEVGSGTTFTVHLPVSVGAGVRSEEIAYLSSDEVDGSARLTTDIRQSTVLYIEDNPSNQQVMKRVIGRITDCELLIAADAETGLTMAQLERPNVILMDINLPGMNGYEALERLRNDPETTDIPVIAVSANAMRHDIEKGKQAGFLDYLTKPIEIDEVLTAVKKAVAGRR